MAEYKMLEKLKEYLANTPQEQLDKDWEALKEWGEIGPTVEEFLAGGKQMYSMFHVDISGEWNGYYYIAGALSEEDLRKHMATDPKTIEIKNRMFTKRKSMKCFLEKNVDITPLSNSAYTENPYILECVGSWEA